MFKGILLLIIFGQYATGLKRNIIKDICSKIILQDIVPSLALTQ